MRVLFYIDQLKGGGAKRVTSIISNGLVERGYEVHIIVSKSRELGYPINDKIKIHFVSAPVNKTSEELDDFLKNLRNEVISISPDVMVGVVHFGYYHLWLATKGLGIPIVASDHNNFHKDISKKIHNIRFYYYDFADTTVVLTKNDQEYMKDFLHNMWVINNPLSFPILEEEVKKEKTILCGGRLDVWDTKGIDLIIKIWAMIADKYPDWTLKIAGGGKEDNLEYLTGLVKEEGIEDSVEFLGFREDIQDVMRRSSIFTLSSREEGFPCVLLEAMSQGCAPVAFEIYGNIREIITDGMDGFLIPDGHLEQFAEKLEILINNEEIRKTFRENARESLKRFSPEKIIDQWEEMLINVVNKRK